MNDTPAAVHQYLWGKTDRKGGDAYHPLFCHMVDVGAVAHAFLTAPDADHIVRRLSVLAGLPLPYVAPVCSFLLAAHDLGKASPSFQAKSPAHWQRLIQRGLSPSPIPIEGFRHDLEARQVLGPLLEEMGLLAPSGRPLLFFDALAQALGSHHGVFFGPSDHSGYPEVPAEADERNPWRANWQRLRRGLLADLRAAFAAEVPLNLPCAPHNLSALCMALAGLGVLCDWIGSDELIFRPYEGPLDAYPTLARERAQKALEGRELLSYLPLPADEPTFASLFPEMSPRPLQQAMEAISLPGPTLAIVEAPTGEGKTEAALLLAARLARQGAARGFYFALPTMATGNQMFGRIEEYLRAQVPPGQRAALLLVHGQAALSDDLARLVEAARHDGLAAEDAVVADSWLLPRKRSLLSPYGVGTVDQAMVGALNVRHGALRLFGLASKVVIVDEVHAYDLYMSTILDRLLSWLRELGASVIVLSATLTRSRRERLIAAYTGQPCPPGDPARPDPYPLVTLVDGLQPGRPPQLLTPQAASSRRTVRLERRLDGEACRRENAEWLLGEITPGGCVAWICNTVGEAQESYLVLRDLVRALPESERPELTLFHARFPAGRRRAREERVLSQFGKTGNRPARAILVATQVVEQSLDLDFDMLMSQWAPVDLLLQRLGRTHRHAGRKRPPKLKQPRLVLLEPARDERGRLAFGPYVHVYQPWVLLKTWLALHGRDTLEVPGDVRDLIERVYDDANPPAEEAAAAGVCVQELQQAKREMEKDQDAMEAEAKQRLLKKPDAWGRFAANPGLSFTEDQAEDYAYNSFQTRLADPSARVVLLEDGAGLPAPSPDRGSLERAELRRLLDRSISLAHRPLVRYLTKGPDDCRVHPLSHLRGLYGYYALDLEQGVFRWCDEGRAYRLELSEELGVIILAEGRRE